MPTQRNDSTDNEPLSFDETVKRALAFCDTLPPEFADYRRQLAELQTRLSGGRLHFAVLGQFNRGKSTFINALLGIKALPTSVLPLTSVATVIEYGTEKSCKIRFTDGRDDLAVSGSDEEIEATLRQYVAEENNPKNKYMVRDATITCASELLINGTALIDTPGFGSTHLHNTKTTLDLLAECDAALFLLSADPPMTQTEMEFLRDVKERVPKLFFVLNKVDLLNQQGVSEVDGFIRNILRADLRFPADTVLYRTSAVKGLSAKKRTDDDPVWRASGLEAVKQEVLDFMVREKYFTLSDALHGKYREAMTAIGALLERKLGEKTAPIHKLRKEADAITEAIQSLGLEMEAQIKKCAESKDAADAAVEAWTNDNMGSYRSSMRKALDVLTAGKYFPVEAASIASAMLPKHSADLGARHLGAMIELANKSIRAIIIKGQGLSGRGQENPVAGDGNAPDRFEIGTAGISDIFNAEAWETPHPRVMDMFRGKAARFEAIREFYEPLCVESITKNINKASERAKELIDAAWVKMQAHINTLYGESIGKLNADYNAKRKALDEAEGAVREETAFLKERIRELGALGPGAIR